MPFWLLWQNQRKVRVMEGAWGGSRQGFLSVLPGSGQNRRTGVKVTHVPQWKAMEPAPQFLCVHDNHEC